MSDYLRDYFTGIIEDRKEIEKNIEKKWKKAYEKGYKETKEACAWAVKKAYEQGYNGAKKKYCITYPCSICGSPIEVSRDKPSFETAEFAAQIALDGWHHKKCPR